MDGLMVMMMVMMIASIVGAMFPRDHLVDLPVGFYFLLSFL